MPTIRKIVGEIIGAAIPAADKRNLAKRILVELDTTNSQRPKPYIESWTHYQL